MVLIYIRQAFKATVLLVVSLPRSVCGQQNNAVGFEKVARQLGLCVSPEGDVIECPSSSEGRSIQSSWLSIFPSSEPISYPTTSSSSRYDESTSTLISSLSSLGPDPTTASTASFLEQPTTSAPIVLPTDPVDPWSVPIQTMSNFTSESSAPLPSMSLTSVQPITSTHISITSTLVISQPASTPTSTITTRTGPSTWSIILTVICVLIALVLVALGARRMLRRRAARSEREAIASLNMCVDGSEGRNENPLLFTKKNTPFVSNPEKVKAKSPTPSFMCAGDRDTLIFLPLYTDSHQVDHGAGDYTGGVDDVAISRYPELSNGVDTKSSTNTSCAPLDCGPRALMPSATSPSHPVDLQRSSDFPVRPIHDALVPGHMPRYSHLQQSVTYLAGPGLFPRPYRLPAQARPRGPRAPVISAWSYDTHRTNLGVVSSDEAPHPLQAIRRNT